MKISEILESRSSNNYSVVSTILKNMERNIIDSIDRVYNLDSGTHIDVVKSIVVDIDDVINDINVLMTQMRINLNNKNPNDKQLISLMAKIRNNITPNRDKLRDVGLNEADQPPQASLMSPIPGTPDDLQPKPSPRAVAKNRREQKKMNNWLHNSTADL